MNEKGSAEYYASLYDNVREERDGLRRRIEKIQDAWREYHIKCPDSNDEKVRRERARKELEKLL